MPPARTCECGECPKCKKRVYMQRWYRDHADQIRERVAENRRANVEHYRDYDRARAKERNRRNMLQYRAGRNLRNGVLRGQIQKMPCEVCGAEVAEAHHEDYTKPRDVRWLCHKHHMELHRVVP